MTKKEAIMIARGDLLEDKKTKTNFYVFDIQFTNPCDMKNTNYLFFDYFGEYHLHRNCKLIEKVNVT